MILIFIFGNYGINEYYKSKRIKLKILLKNEILIDIESIFGEIIANSKISYTFYKILCEIIITKNQIYILPKIYNFRGKITLNQPIIQINFNKNDSYKNPYCSRFLTKSNLIKIGKQIRITAIEKEILTGNYKIILNLQNEKEVNIVLNQIDFESK